MHSVPGAWAAVSTAGEVLRNAVRRSAKGRHGANKGQPNRRGIDHHQSTSVPAALRSEGRAMSPASAVRAKEWRIIAGSVADDHWCPRRSSPSAARRDQLGRRKERSARFITFGGCLQIAEFAESAQMKRRLFSTHSGMSRRRGAAHRSFPSGGASVQRTPARGADDRADQQQRPEMSWR